jgi:hypothetical protein
MTTNIKLLIWNEPDLVNVFWGRSAYRPRPFESSLNINPLPIAMVQYLTMWSHAVNFLRYALVPECDPLSHPFPQGRTSRVSPSRAQALPARRRAQIPGGRASSRTSKRTARRRTYTPGTTKAACVLLPPASPGPALTGAAEHGHHKRSANEPARHGGVAQHVRPRHWRVWCVLRFGCAFTWGQ